MEFDPQMAALYGLEEAVMIKNLTYWIAKNKGDKRHFYEGRYWTYNSAKSFSIYFYFWSRRKICRILQSLVDKNVIMKGNFNKMPGDNTMWYAFTDEFLKTNPDGYFPEAMDKNRPLVKNDQPAGQKCPVVWSKMTSPLVKNDQALPNNNTKRINKYNTDRIKSGENEIFAPAQDESDPVSSQSKNEEKENCAKEKEVRPEVIINTPGRRRTSEGLCLFENSKYYDRIDEIKEQFTDEKYRGVDIDYYIEAVADWSARKGVKRRDWIAEIRSFIRKDVEAKKVHKVQDIMAGLPQDAIDYLKMGWDDLGWGK